MEHKVNECIDRIRVTRGVNCGQISEEQLGNLFSLFQLNADEQSEVRAYLFGNGIQLTPEIELNCASQKAPLAHSEMEDTNVRKEVNRERYRKAQDECLHAMADNQELVSQYGDELPLLKEAIARHAPKHEVRPYSVVSRAVMDIRAVKAREGRKGAWICGTYLNRVKESFERWLRYHIAKEDMVELIWMCSNVESLELEYEQMLIVIIHNAPKIYANRTWSNDELNMQPPL